MTTVTAIRDSIAVNADRPPRNAASASRSSKAASARALIALEPITPSDADLYARPQSGFLAHLIATAGQFPQTRERRRADPADAIAAYRAAKAERRPLGRRLFRLT
jgi:hypothetical protein